MANNSALAGRRKKSLIMRFRPLLQKDVKSNDDFQEYCMKLALLNNMRYVRIPKDGSCQFHAVLVGLNNLKLNAENYDANSLRNALADYIINERSDSDAVLQNALSFAENEEGNNIESITFDEFIKRVRYNTSQRVSWGNQATLQFLSRFLKVQFVMASRNVTNVGGVELKSNTIQYIPEGIERDERRPCIFLVYDGGLHYESMIRNERISKSDDGDSSLVGFSEDTVQNEYQRYCSNFKLKPLRRRDCRVDNMDEKRMNEYCMVRSVGLRNNCSVENGTTSGCDNDALFTAVINSVVSQGYSICELNNAHLLRAKCYEILQKDIHLYIDEARTNLLEEESIEEYIASVGEGRKADDLTVRLICDSQGLAINMITINTRDCHYDENVRGFYADTPVSCYSSSSNNRVYVFIAKVIDSEQTTKYFHIVPILNEIDRLKIRSSKKPEDMSNSSKSLSKTSTKRKMFENEAFNHTSSSIASASVKRKEQIPNHLTGLSSIDTAESSSTKSLQSSVESCENGVERYRSELKNYHEFTRSFTFKNIEEADLKAAGVLCGALPSTGQLMSVVEMKNNCFIDNSVIDEEYDLNGVSMMYAILQSLRLQGYPNLDLNVAALSKLCLQQFGRDPNRYRKLLSPILEKYNISELDYLKQIGRVSAADNISMLLIANALDISICTFVVPEFGYSIEVSSNMYQRGLFGNPNAAKRAFVYQIKSKYWRRHKAMKPCPRNKYEAFALQSMKKRFDGMNVL
jgi:hypothetical protein